MTVGARRGYPARVREHRHRFRPIYGDTDMMGVVYYANYLRFFEAGRTELLRAAGVDYRGLESSGFMLPVAEAEVKYHRPSRYDDPLELTTSVVEVGFARIRIRYRLVNVEDGTLIATGQTVHACLGPEGKLARLPDALRGRLEADAPAPGPDAAGPEG